jgi:hypothetical protein
MSILDGGEQAIEDRAGGSTVGVSSPASPLLRFVTL